MTEKMTGELRVLQQLNKYEFAFEADILRTGPVQGGRWEFRNLEKNYRSFRGQPVLVAYTNFGNKVGDGHNSTDKVDPETGEPYRSFTAPTAERIVGMISADESDLTLVERENQLWLRVKGKIWAEYAHELIQHLTLTGSMSVSVEVMVEEGFVENGVEIYEVWNGIGLTVLGDDVAPAVPTANIRALAAMQDEFEEMKLRVASLVKEETEAETVEPQNNSEKKGMTKHMRLSKQQLRELQAKFGEYTVLAAEQGENGVVVCLMGKSGETAIYLMASLDEAVYPEKVQAVNAQAHFCSEGCEDVLVDACDMVETMTASVREMSAKLETAEKNLNAANATVEQMVNAENARRLAAAKKTAKDTLDRFNANREDGKVNEDAIKALCAEIEEGKFTACEDENHAWIGDKTVEEKVLSLCATAVMEMDKKHAEMRAAADKNTFVWEKLASGEGDDGSVEALLARKGITG